MNFRVSAATTNTFIPLNHLGSVVNSTDWLSFTGVATAEKVIPVAAISQTNPATVSTHGAHGFTNATHVGEFVTNIKSST